MAEKTNYDWTRGFLLDFSLKDGFSLNAASIKRRLSQMKGMYNDTAAFEKIAAEGDPLVYEFYELGAPQNPGDLAFGTSITYPGKVGNEYFMTKGHFHTVLETAEVYYTLSGEGGMLLENPEGDTEFYPMEPGKAVYVPPRYAHRSINTGKVPLVSFFVFRGDAGHNYAAIETKGYRKLVVEGSNGKPQVIDNPRWA
ncbi:MAG: cupin domain-containing protein [Spirochaetaceae bacterium]|jgi:glucose-6-phosphate isomerase|nr:cupin domain-containing protein [Spirochaetaceae bacterium]